VSVQNGTTTELHVIVKVAPSLTLYVNGKGQLFNAFWDASLSEVRSIVRLDSSISFLYAGLTIIRAEEEFILLREILVGSAVYASGSSTGGSTSGGSEKDQAAVVEVSKYNDAAGRINITGKNVTLDTNGNPVGPQYDLVKDGSLNVTVLVYDNHGGIATNLVQIGLGEKGITFNATSSE